MARSSSSGDEFDVNQVVRISEHEKLSSRVQDLERLNTSEAFSSSFCKAASEFTKVRDCLSGVFVELLQKNENCRCEIRKLADERDKHAVRALIFRVGKWLGYGLMYALGLATQAIITKYIH